jgi:hypothetical protein
LKPKRATRWKSRGLPEQKTCEKRAAGSANSREMATDYCRRRLPRRPLFKNDANLNSLRKDERFVAFMAKLKQQLERYIATISTHIKA